MPAPRSTKICSASWVQIQGYADNVHKSKRPGIFNLNRSLPPRFVDSEGLEVMFTSMKPDRE
jgi:hypothetical protein